MAITRGPKGLRQRPAARSKPNSGPNREEAQQTFRAFAWNLAAALSEHSKAERQRGGSQQ